MRQPLIGNEGETHDELAEDLARFLRASGLIALTKFQLPHGGQQVDVLAIAPYKYARPDIRAYEVKVSRADFRADERAAKWAGYLRYANRVFFAAAGGLLKVQDIPEDAGLITRGAKGWGVVKTGRYRLEMPGWDNDAWMAFVSRRQDHDREQRRLEDRVVWDENLPLQERAKNLGWRVREQLRAARAIPAESAPFEERERIARLEQMWETLRQLFPGVEDRELLGRVEAVAHVAKYTEAIHQIGQFLASIEWGGGTYADQRVTDARNAIAAVGR
jgi:hypothetical protein